MHVRSRPWVVSGGQPWTRRRAQAEARAEKVICPGRQNFTTHTQFSPLFSPRNTYAGWNVCKILPGNLPKTLPKKGFFSSMLLLLLWTEGAAAVTGGPRRELQPGAATPQDSCWLPVPEPPLPGVNWEITSKCTVALHLGEKAWETDVVYRWKSPDEGSHGEAINRYRDNGELRFSMRSFAHLKGLRFFHIIAYGAPPSWLNLSHPRVFWWNETAMLDDLRQERGITEPLDVANSEPSKLVVARVPNLAPRFILTDDDYFIYPRPDASTRLFFDKAGIPIIPHWERPEHRPIAFLRDAYREAVRKENNTAIAQLLTSGIANDGEDLRMSIDPLRRFAARMREAGTAMCHYMPRFFAECANSSQCIRESSMDRDTANCSTHKKSKFAHFMLKRWEPIDGVYITAEQSSDFFATVEQEEPMTFCVNDDWPLDDEDYEASVEPFRAYVARAFPVAAPWEKEVGEIRLYWRSLRLAQLQQRQARQRRLVG